MNYTKGEWKVKYEGEVGRAGSRIYVVGKDGFAIARIADKEEREANAQLIAAAPDMYEALKTLIHGIDRDCNEFDHYFSFEKDSPLADILRKALAKAEGK